MIGLELKDLRRNNDEIADVRTLIEASQNEALLSERNTIPRMRKIQTTTDYLYTYYYTCGYGEAYMRNTDGMIS